jgi:signal peptidase I
VARAVWLVLLLGTAAVLIAIPFAVRQRFEGFSVPSASMEPALLPGDYILVDKSVREAARGQVIVFADPRDVEERLVKRVIGLGGEEVTVAGRDVYVGCAAGAPGCRALPEPYAWFSGPSRTPERFGPFRVPAGGYFVMADNRHAGEDSRIWGAVSWERITGRPLLVYWSRDPATHAVRWSRLGLRVR